MVGKYTGHGDAYISVREALKAAAGWNEVRVAVVDVDSEQRSVLRPEMTALAYIEIGALDDVLRVPITAVKSRSDGWYVTRMDAGAAVEARVEVGWKDETGVEIRAGLAEGDEILLNP